VAQPLSAGEGPTLAQALEGREQERARSQKLVRFEADLSEIRRLLAPFIAPGKKQLAKGGRQALAEPEPVSLSGLISNGYLDPAPATYLRMIQIAGPFSQNDRPLGTFPGTQEPTAFARFQHLLNEYGDILVARKMLLP